jgi:3-oxoadipate enol-lactonase
MLVHGYPLDHSIWNEVVPRLKKDFDLIVPDLRGFGQSASSNSRYELADMAADLSGLLEHLKIEKTLMAGHSMGGYITMAFARAFPNRLLGLGLVSSQALADSPEKKAGRMQEAESVLAKGVRETAESMSAKLTSYPDLQTKLKELIMKQRPEGLAGALLAMAERPDSMNLLARLDLPVLIVHGRGDMLIPVERARSAARILKKGVLVEIEAAGHVPMMEAPQETAEAIKTLLE